MISVSRRTLPAKTRAVECAEALAERCRQLAGFDVLLRHAVLAAFRRSLSPAPAPTVLKWIAPSGRDFDAVGSRLRARAGRKSLHPCRRPGRRATSAGTDKRRRPWWRAGGSNEPPAMAGVSQVQIARLVEGQRVRERGGHPGCLAGCGAFAQLDLAEDLAALVEGDDLRIVLGVALLPGEPSASASGAVAVARNSVPFGNFFVAMVLTAKPSGPVRPSISFSFTTFSVPSGCTSSLLT